MVRAEWIWHSKIWVASAKSSSLSPSASPNFFAKSGGGCPSLKCLDRQLSVAHLREIATLHETLYTGLDDFFNHRLNDRFAVHKLAPSSLFSGQYLIEQCIVCDCRYMNRSRNLLEAIG